MFFEALRLDPSLSTSVKRIRAEKDRDQRPVPSSSFDYSGTILPAEHARWLVDSVAGLVDENIFGRSEMCVQFAELIALSVQKLGYPATAVQGKAEYRLHDGTWFPWSHAWVIVDDLELVDGNVDSMPENPIVPSGLAPRPFWGPIKNLPDDRVFRSATAFRDSDDVGVWWPRLEVLIDSKFSR